MSDENQDVTKLIWIDLEMTGLDVREDKIIEIGTIITDHQLNIIAQGPELAIYQPQQVLDNMDAWNTKQHTKSEITSVKIERFPHS